MMSMKIINVLRELGLGIHPRSGIKVIWDLQITFVTNVSLLTYVKNAFQLVVVVIKTVVPIAAREILFSKKEDANVKIVPNMTTLQLCVV